MKMFVLGAMFLFGLALAGSDGDWLPWHNFVGLGLLLVVAVQAKNMKGA